MPKFAVDGVNVVAVLGCIAALAACGSSESRLPKPATTQEAGAAQIPGDGGPKSDAAGAEQVVGDFSRAFAKGDGDAACDLMSDAGIAGVVDDGKQRTVDEAYALCVETVESLSGLLDGKEKAALRDVAFTGTTVDGDTARVGTSVGDEPIAVVHAGDGWLLDNSPAVGS